MDTNMMVAFASAAIVAGTPLVFATVGEIITEKSGLLNLGVEGLMMMGAVMGFSIGLTSGNPLFALMAAMIAGACGSLIFAFLTISLRANQVVTGLTMTIFGTGFASFMGQQLIGQVTTDSVKAFFKVFDIPILSKIPYLGKIFFSHDIFVYIGYIVAIGSFYYLFKTKPGRNIRAIGENPGAADAAGINVTIYKYVHVLAGGALCGLGGAYLSLVAVPAWQDGVTAGRGWIAVALVIFASWNPLKALVGAYFFGGLSILGFYQSTFGLSLSTYVFDMVPYIATIAVLVFVSMRKSRELSPPKSLSIPYFREER